MKVGAKIIHDLSSGIYSDPANCIKELIHNSYDADATKVIIRAKPDFNTFSITDDGDGMNYKDFDSKFTWISRSDKRDKGYFSKIYKRPLIGKIGIGFIAISQICDNMEVISTKKGEPYKFVANIDFSRYKKSEAAKMEFVKKSKYGLTNYQEEEKEHYTMIILTGLQEGFKAMLQDKDWERIGKRWTTFEGLIFEEIISKIENDGIEEVSKEVGGYWRLLLELAAIIPVPYFENGPICAKNLASKIIDKIKKQVTDLNFQVDFDGILLKKPIRLPNDKEIFADPNEFYVKPINKKFNFEDGSHLEFRGYIYNQREQILPRELSGIIIRIKNAAVGASDFSGADHTFLNYPFAERMYMNWTFGEIYIEDGLEEAMNIDRSTFLTTHPHYRELRNFLHETLHQDVFKESRVRYIKRRERRKKDEELNRLERLNHLVNKILGPDFSLAYIDEKCESPIFTEKNKIIISKKHEFYKYIPKKQRDIVEEVLISLELSIIKSNNNIILMKNKFPYYFKKIREGK
ncbi:MAG: ATP-binding protein [Nanoarchaeota archaeon]|nr:ATP-binding protein [Nanoarchaeota archaeon]